MRDRTVAEVEAGSVIPVRDSPLRDGNDPRTPLLAAHFSASYPNRADVVRDIELTIDPGKILGLVGQSGSGKSTIALALLGLLPLRGGTVRGEIRFEGDDLLALGPAALRSVRGRRLAFVPQSPVASLNPALRIGAHFAEAWRAHEARDPGRSHRRAMEVLEQVSLPATETFLRCFPRQLSVGQAQRVLIALAILHRPSLLIADEPTSALDVLTQVEIVRLFRQLNREQDLSILFISHDLLSVASLCDQVAILESGIVVEAGPVGDVFHAPRHPYSQRLIGALTPSLAAWEAAGVEPRP